MPEATKICPASMCPLIAPDGSPWSGRFASPCPGHADARSGGCPVWAEACAVGVIQVLVEEAEKNGGKSIMVIAGPNGPKRHTIGPPRSFDCPQAGVCRWQAIAESEGRVLCPPRDALARGVDPRVCLY